MTIKAVRRDDLATFSVADGMGWVRRPVPSDGLLIEDDSTTVFISAEQARAALAELDAPRRKR